MTAGNLLAGRQACERMRGKGRTAREGTTARSCLKQTLIFRRFDGEDENYKGEVAAGVGVGVGAGVSQV